MANYSYIGYDPGSLIFSGGTITLSGSYDPDVDRRVFDVTDGAGGTVLGGEPDTGMVFDGDRYNNENGDDSTQTGDATNLDGTVTYASGNMYLEESYSLNKPGGGTIDIYRVEVDGTLVGYITSEPLEAGVSYTYSTSNVTPFNAPDTSDLDAIIDVPCFAAGTMIRTPDGDRLIDGLTAGDLVTTASGEVKTIRWIGRRTVLPPFATRNDLWPIRIAAGALGHGLPVQDLVVSPNHRMLISSPSSELFFGTHSVLVAAKFLATLPGVAQLTDLPSVTYFHMLFDTHEIVCANGAPSESLYPGDMSLRGMAAASRDEITTIFPELAQEVSGNYGSVAAPVLKRGEAKLLTTFVSEEIAVHPNLH